MNTNDLILNIVTEAALDSRIPDGIVNLKNVDHLQIVAEKLYDTVLSEDIVNEFIKNFLQEGKYPDRQAYNREGWLVTFPSREYRDAAIKKGTHAISDPTHGRGGMNLYYKKRGKQKRQTQQTSTDTSSPERARPKPVPVSSPQSSQVPASQPASEPAQDTEISASEPEKIDSKEPISEPTQMPSDKPSSDDSGDKPVFGGDDEVPEEPKAPTGLEAPAVDVPVVETPPEKYESISKKFAQKKGWISEPYGEYRDREGNTVAVVGLSGEIVPIKSVDRDEYKLFAEKSMT